MEKKKMFRAYFIQECIENLDKELDHLKDFNPQVIPLNQISILKNKVDAIFDRVVASQKQKE